MSIITASVPRIKQVLVAGGSGISYPQIQESELSMGTKTASDQASRGLELRLVPSDTGKVTVTVTSGGRKKSKMPSDWQGMMTVGSKEDEHTSTSSLFDETDREYREGVMLEHEFEMVVENQ